MHERTNCHVNRVLLLTQFNSSCASMKTNLENPWLSRAIFFQTGPASRSVPHASFGPVCLCQLFLGDSAISSVEACRAFVQTNIPFDFPRFLDLMAKHLKPESFDRQLRDAFKVLDKDGTGYVVVSDLRHILTSIGEKVEPAEFDEWIREVDVGSNGKIRYEDFITRMVAK